MGELLELMGPGEKDLYVWRDPGPKECEDTEPVAAKSAMIKPLVTSESMSSANDDAK